MKVLIVSKALVSSAYRAKLREMAPLGAEVIAVVPPEWREAGGVQRLEPGDDHTYEMRVTPMRFNGRFHAHYYPQLPRIIREVRPDLVHLDEEPFNFATFHGAAAAWRARVPYIFFSWQNLLKRYPPPFSLFERAVFRGARLAIAGSGDVEGVLRAKGYTGLVTVIPQFGVDAERFHPGERRPGPFAVGFPNRLVPGKAPLLALRAFAHLPAETRLVMAGDGPMRDAVADEVARLGLEDRVEIRARVPSDEVPEMMRSFDVVLLPSLTLPGWKEQFGRVLIEAMASGVPVIGSSSGEIPRVTGGGGLIVPEGDEPALAEALLRLYDDQALREELGRKGRERVLRHYTHARIAHSTLEAYAAALGD